MKKQRILLFFTCFLLHLPGLQSLTLKSKFTHAETGDFVVCESKGVMTLLFIKSADPRVLILEEITFPKKAKPKRVGIQGWQQWLASGAPGHTSWVALEIDLEETGIMECFSYTRDAWLSLSTNDSFLLHLFDLTLDKIPDHERKKIGPPPEKHPDTRKIWEPPLVIDGKKQSHRAFDVYRVEWPKDDTPLSQKQVEIYFNQKDKLFPFPHLLRVRDTNNLSVSFYMIDSGKGLTSPKGNIPRRIFYLTKTNFQKTDRIEIELTAPLYYKKFSVHALDASGLSPGPIPLSYHLERTGEKVLLQIEKSLVKKKLNEDHSYTLLISTDSPTPVSVQSRDVFTLH